MRASRTLMVVCAMTAIACTSAPSTTPTPTAATPVATPDGPAATATAQPSEAAFEPAWVIQGFDGRRTIIELIAADGSGRHSPTTDVPGSFQTNPDWSPDGSQLTFVVTDQAEHDDLWVTDVDGTGARMLFDCEDSCSTLDDPAWSPDGSSIAACKIAASGDRYVGTLVSVDTQTGAETVLFTPDDADFCAGPRWSPDGTRIVLELLHLAAADPESEISGVTLTMVDLTTDPPTLTPMTDPQIFAATADWSRATDNIVFSALADEGRDATDLFTISPDGGEPSRVTRLADEFQSAFEPSFDGTGTTVVFVHGDGSLRRVDLETGDVGPAFTTRVSANHPRSRPE